MNWTKDQKKIIDSRNCNLLVSAAAGSGKTAVLVERIIQMISDSENPIDIDELLVVTFTKAAAAQMKDKITNAIEKKLAEDPTNEHYINQLNFMSRANILTIDSFCYQVVKEHFHVLEIDPGIRVGEPGELGLLREDVLEKVIESFYKENNDFVRFSEAFSSDKNDSKIEEYIMKTYTICSSYPRPEEWITQAKRSLHIESEEDFNGLLLVQNYFNEVHNTVLGIKYKIMQALEIARSINGPLYMEKALLADITLVDDVIAAKTYSQFKNAAQLKFANIGRGKKGEYDEELAEKVKNMRDEYKKQINGLLSAFAIPFEVVINQFHKQEGMLCALFDATECFRKQFLEAKLQKGILEFSDVEHFALQVLCKGYDEAGEPIPSEIGKEMSEGFKEILIDEYQDSNYLQEAILKCVSTLHRGKHNIFMVGDVKQSIYSFRMARPDLFMQKYHTYSSEKGAECRKLLLKNNFRSQANVLETINYMFYQIMGEDLGGIEYTSEEALIPGKKFPDGVEDSVELLLGESKDFAFLNAEDSEVSSKKDENLNENLEDIGKIELEATIVANKISEMLGRQGNAPYQITDEQTGELRNVTLKDIVILFRAPSSFQQIFSEVLLKNEIPVKVQNEKGYFDTTEIQTILSLLKVVDNPHNDIEVAAVLRSYFVGFNSNELALLALVKRYVEEESGQKQPLYKIVRYLAECDMKKENKVYQILENKLHEHKELLTQYMSVKCAGFISLIDKLQADKAYRTIVDLLNDIYYQVGYYYYVEAMPEGNQRIGNLDLFYEETKRFENSSYKTLFDFLAYIDKVMEKAIAIGGESVPDSGENVVRIMSIHKSKGLEFPVVFLSGIGKGFNLTDTKTPLILHSDYYIGAKYIDTNRRCGNDTFARKALSSLIVTENIAEELRILYVGLTRAKEKLIMTGVTPDITALIKKYEAVGERKNTQLSYSIVHTAKNYLDFIVMALIRNETFHEAMNHVRKRMDKKTDNIISAEYVLSAPIKEPNVNLQVHVYDFKNLAVQHIQSNVEKQMNRNSKLEELSNAPAQQCKEIEERLSWIYPKENLTVQKSKLSVTEIKRMYEEKSQTYEDTRNIVTAEYTPPVPQFISKKTAMDAASKGTWVHKMMELLPNESLVTQQDVQEALTEMWNSGRLPEECKEFITVEKVYAFIESDLGARMHRAAQKGNLHKEKQFVIGVSAGEGTPIVVQGIIDAYFEENDGLILLDYKTDKIKKGQEQLLVERYKTQLQYYKDTLEQLTGLKVKETYIYSYSLDKEILV